MGLFEPELPAHAKHPRTGYPLCWKSDQEGLFEVVHDEGQVTCSLCLLYMKAGPWTIFTDQKINLSSLSPIQELSVQAYAESLKSGAPASSGSALSLSMPRYTSGSGVIATIVKGLPSSPTTPR